MVWFGIDWKFLFISLVSLDVYLWGGSCDTRVVSCHYVVGWFWKSDYALVSTERLVASRGGWVDRVGGSFCLGDCEPLIGDYLNAVSRVS